MSRINEYRNGSGKDKPYSCGCQCTATAKVYLYYFYLQIMLVGIIYIIILEGRSMIAHTILRKSNYFELISQHNFCSAQYTLHSVSPSQVPWNTFFRKILILVKISFDVIFFFLPSIFFFLGHTSFRGPNMASTVDEATVVRTSIHQLSALKLHKCKTVRCLGGTTSFFD